MSANENPQRVLITGASGFLGGRIVEAMTLSGFATPVGTIRHWTRAARVARHASEVVLCDILDKEQTREAMSNVDAVVHCAYTDDRAAIVDGTRNLLEAAVEHGVTRFVYLSSAEVYDNRGQGDYNEDQATHHQDGCLYKNAKIDAETVCREFHSRGLAPTILRPSLIYGPYSTSWTVDAVKRLQSGRWGLFDQSDGIANLIYVDDLVQAIFLCLGKDEAMGQTFNINGASRLTWNEYYTELNASLGLPELAKVSSGKSKLRTMCMDAVGKMADIVLDRFEDKIMEIYLRGGLASRLMKNIKGELDATPTGNELNDLFGRQVYYVDQKARDLIGYDPQFDLDRSLRLTLEWLRLHEVVQGGDFCTGDGIASIPKRAAEVVTP